MDGKPIAHAPCVAVDATSTSTVNFRSSFDPGRRHEWGRLLNGGSWRNPCRSCLAGIRIALGEQGRLLMGGKLKRLPSSSPAPSKGLDFVWDIRPNNFRFDPRLQFWFYKRRIINCACTHINNRWINWRRAVDWRSTHAAKPSCQLETTASPFGKTSKFPGNNSKPVT